jgi:hypothetical protein
MALTYAVKKGEFKGNDVLIIGYQTSSGFSGEVTLGKLKARAVVDNINMIDEWVCEQENKPKVGGGRKR